MLSNMKVRKHIYFSGCVQGVGFRYRSACLARTLDLTGWVKNLEDGRVEMEIQGKTADIEQFLVQLRQQRYIAIDHMEISDIPVLNESRFRTVAW